MAEPKKTGTFVINVLRQENSTWQGDLTWADKNLRQKFRSTLELMKMMDEALSEDDK